MAATNAEIEAVARAFYNLQDCARGWDREPERLKVGFLSLASLAMTALATGPWPRLKPQTGPLRGVTRIPVNAGPITGHRPAPTLTRSFNFAQRPATLRPSSRRSPASKSAPARP